MQKQHYFKILLMAISLYGGTVWAQPEPAPIGLRPMTTMGGGYDTERSAKSTLLGQQTVNGMTAVAYIQDVGALMAQMGRKENTRFVVMFTDQSSDAAVLTGQAVLNIVAVSDKQEGEIVALAKMDEHFEAEVVLPAKASLHLEVRYTDAAGQLRQFPFLLKR